MEYEVTSAQQDVEGILGRRWSTYTDNLFERLTLTVDWQKCERSIMRKGDKKSLLWKDAYETWIGENESVAMTLWIYKKCTEFVSIKYENTDFKEIWLVIFKK
jgi:hypothetical protein